MSEQQPQWKWVIAELVGERRQEHWVRRNEEFDTEDQAHEWIGRQADPTRFEVREIAGGTA